MPYTVDDQRKPYRKALDLIENEGIATEGDLEYLICSLQDIFAAEKEFRYTWLRRCKGSTEHAAYEFGRRFLDKREDSAVVQNGEVFLRMKRKFGSVNDVFYD